ncbi:MAG: OmpA family protein [Gammaproteobacteria bacterium]|nr:OmpA family protein [Gammaproteobacteria bacterium]
MKIFRYLLPLLVSGFLVSCGSNEVKTDDASSSAAASASASNSRSLDSESSSVGIEDPQGVMLDALDDPDNTLTMRVIYFEYDSAEVEQDSLDAVRSHGQYLSVNTGRLLRLEGHADERGTREYNLALGESRAKTVRDLLILEGAQPEQIEVVSFGEERPAVFGSDEASLQKNRRVEIVY